MELTRRDATKALAAAGIVVGGGVLADRWLGEESSPPSFDEHALQTTIAVAHAVYPSQLENVESFVRTYALSRSENDDDYRSGMAAAVAGLDEYARTWRDADYRDHDPEVAETLLYEMGVDVEDPDPEGTAAERVRFYLVNELLYALYTTPTGGRLVGIENPQGHPGGTDSYQRGPDRPGTAEHQHQPTPPDSNGRSQPDASGDRRSTRRTDEDRHGFDESGGDP
jgi:hypothetical protein